MKKIDKLVLDAFIGPFIITFLVVVFILLNVNMLKYFDDIFGKGLDGIILLQLFFYFGIFTIPTALPLAVLLSTLIAFGNLGEHFELTAIKSAGVSLVRSMLSIFLFVVMLTGVAFYANNNLVPLAALEAYSLLHDIRQQKPALELREGAFFNGIKDISIKVDHKYPDGITLKNVMVYDHRKNDGNKEVTVADSGRMYTILNERYMKFELYNGYHYAEGASSERELTGQKGRRNAETLTRSKFSKSQVVFDLSGEFVRTDKKWFQGNRIMRNLAQLSGDRDSIRGEILSQQLSYYQYRPAHFSYFRKSEKFTLPQALEEHRKRRDSLSSLAYISRNTPAPVPAPASSTTLAPSLDSTKNTHATKGDSFNNNKEKRSLTKTQPISVKENKTLKKGRLTTKNITKSNQPSTKKKKSTLVKKKIKEVQEAQSAKIIITDSLISARIDSIYSMQPTRDHYTQATNVARQVKAQIENVNSQTKNYTDDLIIFDIQWHKILASSFACIAMFMIGAPLGAIIKRGGLGVPFLVSIVFFIVYYIITMQGEKLAKQGAIHVVSGVWSADIILFTVGLFFLRQARVDARILEADFYRVILEKLKRRISNHGAVKTTQPMG